MGNLKEISERLNYKSTRKPQILNDKRYCFLKAFIKSNNYYRRCKYEY